MRRQLRILAAAGVALATLAGCAQQVDGDGTTVPGATSSGSTAGSTAPSSSPGPKPTSFPSEHRAARFTTSDELLAVLSRPPAHSDEWIGSWGETATLSLEQFVNHFYYAQYRSQIRAELRKDGFDAVVHRTWEAPNDDEADMLLMGFDDQEGALRWYSEETKGQGSASNVTTTAVAGVPEAYGYVFGGPDKQGFVHAAFYVPIKNVIVEMWYFSRHAYHETHATAWLEAQVDLLR